MQARVAAQIEQASTASTQRGEWPIWQSALAAWIGQRLLMGGIVALWQALLLSFSPLAFYRVWTTFDGIWYSLIAQYGYHILPEAAYFPLFPLLMRLLAAPLGGRVALAGVLLANGCSLAAFVLLGTLVEREFGQQTARRALLYYALFPTGIFFMSVYTEGLFLLLSVAAFLCLRQRRWLLAGVLITLTTLTRAQGALLLLPLAIEAWRTLRPEWTLLTNRQKLRAVAAVASAFAAPVVAFFTFQRYLEWVYGMPNVLSRAASYSEWKHSLDWPWAGVVNDIATLVAGGQAAPTLEILKDFVFLAFWLALCLLMLFRGRFALPFSWIAYSWASLLQALLIPAHIRGGGLMSMPRYVLVVFPCFALMALVGERYPRAHRLMVALCIAWTIILARLLAGGQFVA